MTCIRLGEWISCIAPDSAPREAMIEVTMRCNLSCRHCFRNALREEIGEMSFSDFKRVLDEVVKAGVKKIVFSGWGEPLVHPHIADMLRMCKERGLYVILNTNGLALSDFAKEVVELGIDEVVVSIDAVDEDLYRKLRVGGEINRVTKALVRLRNLMIEKGAWKPSVSIQFTLSRYNINQLDKLIEYAKLTGATHVFISNLIPLSIEQEAREACYVSEECVSKIKELGAELAKISLSTKVLVNLPSMGVVVERRCPFVFRQATFIRWDGGVAPCIYYAHSWRCAFMGVERDIETVVFGNVLKDSLLDIWRSEEYAKFRFRAYFFSMPSCLDCPLVQYCDYTLSNKYDCWGSNPTCAHCPYSHGIVRCPL